MLLIKCGEEEFELRNEPNELTLKEFDNIFSIVNRPDVDRISSYFEMFELLGVPNSILDNLTQKEFIEMVKSYNDYEIPNTVVQELEINGRKYSSYIGKEFEFKARDISLIEQAQAKADNRFPSWIMAILYKDSELGRNEHFDWNHIKHKANLFRDNVTSDIVAPLMVRIARRQIKTIEEGVNNKDLENGIYNPVMD
jgi:hypothetical protein